jgi:hypothetical protein
VVALVPADATTVTRALDGRYRSFAVHAVDGASVVTE